MAILKCKMCGGDLHFEEGTSICVCEYCGNTNTLPVVGSDQEMNLFNRANHFRMINEFDRAITAYEKILDSDDSNAEAHWGIVLSRYGIEYVEDPTSHERIPTCHRVQMTSILSDPDYHAAVDQADAVAKVEYKAQAERIAEIQKDILAISSQEKPYDVFVCYKETDENGSRTVDSTLAQEIYYGLTESGYRVFFSRITLEDKLGQQYEPYIFAALNSAKVMVVVGTKPENFNAVWVKNEWSRYLAMMKEDRHRLLIPCYRDMDPYDLPDELSILQSQNMSKIGFMQDLLRGINKVLDIEITDSSTQTEEARNDAVAPLVKRAFICLEDGEWGKADDLCEQALNKDPENALAYVGKLMSELQVGHIEDLSIQEESFSDNKYYKNAVRFAEEKLKTELQEQARIVEDQIKEKTYNMACGLMKLAGTEKHYSDPIRLFQSIPDYKDSSDLIKKCSELIDELHTKGIEEWNREINLFSLVEHTVAYDSLTGSLYFTMPNGNVEVIYSSKKEGWVVEERKKYLEVKKWNNIRELQYISFMGSASHRHDLLIGIQKDGRVRILGPEHGNECYLKEVCEWKNIIQICHGSWITGLCANGRVVVSGCSDDQRSVVDSWDDIVFIVQNDDKLAGLRADGTVRVLDTDKQKSIRWKNIEELSYDGKRLFGIYKDRTAVIDDVVKKQEVATWNHIIKTACTGSAALGLRSDGTVVAVNNLYEDHGQLKIDWWKNIINLWACYRYTVGLRSDGKIEIAGGDSLFENHVYPSLWDSLFALYPTFDADDMIIGWGKDKGVRTNREKEYDLTRLNNQFDFSNKQKMIEWANNWEEEKQKFIRDVKEEEKRRSDYDYYVSERERIINAEYAPSIQEIIQEYSLKRKDQLDEINIKKKALLA